MLTASELENIIKESLACDFIQVQGNDGLHYEALIVSPAFAGKTMVQQHKLVYQALGDRMQDEIHALSMRTYSPETWATLK